ncbi:Hypothetical predicted protein [Octopus vulgaris]|uniref:Uncharacterized protein n=1 Tax=Octopus vulgaris TaxID=6645 RepID=A0AA36EWW2_OCTVU|nr:Hypothetical predicted protein [Octopus vulgaris]
MDYLFPQMIHTASDLIERSEDISNRHYSTNILCLMWVWIMAKLSEKSFELKNWKFSKNYSWGNSTSKNEFLCSKNLHLRPNPMNKCNGYIGGKEYKNPHTLYSKNYGENRNFKNDGNKSSGFSPKRTNINHVIQRETKQIMDNLENGRPGTEKKFHSSFCGTTDFRGLKTSYGERDRSKKYQRPILNDFEEPFSYKNSRITKNNWISKGNNFSKENCSRKESKSVCEEGLTRTEACDSLITNEEIGRVFEEELDLMIKNNYDLTRLLNVNSRLKDILGPLAALKDNNISQNICDTDSCFAKLSLMIAITGRKLQQLSDFLINEISSKGEEAVLAALQMPTCHEKLKDMNVNLFMQLLERTTTAGTASANRNRFDSSNTEYSKLSSNDTHCHYRDVVDPFKYTATENQPQLQVLLPPNDRQRKSLENDESDNQKSIKKTTKMKLKQEGKFTKYQYLETPDEKLCAFIDELKKEDIKPNKIMLIENLLSKFGKDLMNPHYSLDCSHELPGGSNQYSASFHLDGLFIARGCGIHKKDLKHKIYSKVYELLLTTPIDDILKLKDPGPYEEQDVPEESEPCLDYNASGNKLVPVIVQLKKFFAEKVFSENISVSVLKQACMKTGSKIDLDYKVEDKFIIHGRPYYKGTLKLNDIILSIGWAFKKKETRQKTYFKAISRLQQLPPEEVGEGIEDSDIPEPDTDVFSLHNTIPPLEERFRSLIKYVRNCNAAPKNSIVCTIDTKSIEVFLNPTVVYQRVGINNNIVKCMLFLSDQFIASAENSCKRESQVVAYNASWETLKTLDVEQLMNQREPLQNEDINGVNIIEVVMKGNQKMLLNTETPETESVSNNVPSQSTEIC